MALTIKMVNGDSIPVTGEQAQDVLLIFDLPMKSPWVKVKTGIGWNWIYREHVTNIIVSEDTKC